MDDDTKTLYCVNDGCEYKSGRYLYYKGAKYKCPECGAEMSTERPRSGQNRRGPRRFDSY